MNPARKGSTFQSNSLIKIKNKKKPYASIRLFRFSSALNQRVSAELKPLLTFNFFQAIEWCTAAQRFFDTNQLVVLSNAI